MLRPIGRFGLTLLWLSAAAANAAIPIEGRVTAEGSGAFRDAEVRLYTVTSVYEEGRRRLLGEDEGEPVARAQVEGDGRFEVLAPGSGLWRVVVSVPRRDAMEFRRPLHGPASLPPLVLGAESSGPTEGSWQKLWKTAPAATDGPRVTLHVLDSRGRSVADALVIDSHGGMGLTTEDGRREVFFGRCRVHGPLWVVTKEGNWRKLETSEIPAEGSLELRLDPLRTVSGQVYSQPGGQPLAGARVWSSSSTSPLWTSHFDSVPFVLFPPWSLTTTDAHGRFELVAPSGGEIRLGAVAADHQSPRPVEVEAAEVTLHLPALATVEGEVVDAQGLPLASVEIRADGVRPSPRWDRAHLPPDSSSGTRSLEDGSFRLAEISAETGYRLRFTKEGFAVLELTVEPVEVFGTRTARVVLHRNRRAVGRVLDAERSPVAGAAVRLFPANWEGPSVPAKYRTPDAVGSTDAEGRFVVPETAPKDYDVEIKAAGFADLVVPGIPVREDGPPEVDLGTFVLEEEAPIEGRVLDESGGAVAGAEIRILRSLESQPALLMDPDFVSDGEGRFRIPGLRPGDRRALAVYKTGYGVQAFEEIAPTEVPLEIVLVRSSRLSGRVVDETGVPLEKVSVSAITDLSYLGRPRVDTDAAGEFVLEDLSPGRWRLYGYKKGFEAAGPFLTVVEAGGDQEGLVLVLKSSRILTVTLRSAAGELLADGGVEVEYKTSTSSSSTGCWSEGDGRYQCPFAASVEKVKVKATHGRKDPITREVDVTTGIRSVELTFEAADAYISGQVLGPDGEPLQDAQLYLSRVRFDSSGRQNRREGLESTRTFADGTFRFEALPAGAYVLWASKEGLASKEVEVQVAEAAVEGLTVQLERGMTLRGRILGVDRADLAEVLVEAMSGGGLSQKGRVDAEGGYAIENLSPGRWLVSARQKDRRAEGQVTLEGGSDAELDLEFAAGWTLNGTVLANGAPLPGATVGLLPSGKKATTDGRGRFHLAPMPAGGGKIVVSVGGQAQRIVSVEPGAGREITVDLTTSSVSGHVRAAAGGEPLTNVRVSMEAEAAQGRSIWERFLVGRGLTRTDARGFFRFENVPPGTFRVKASHDGFGQAEVVVDNRGGDVEGLILELEPTEGITFRAVLESGQVPSSVYALVLDDSGRLAVGGRYQPSAEGTFRMATVPAGNWELWVVGETSVPVRLAVSAPGDAGRVVLSAGGVLRFAAPSLKAAPDPGWLTLVGPDGEVFIPPVYWISLGSDHALTSLPVWTGQGVAGGLMPGAWTYTFRHPDGGTWTGEFTAVAGETVELSLP